MQTGAVLDIRAGVITRVLVAVSVLITGCGPGAGQTPGAAERDDPALVRTATGTVRGVVAADHRHFGGIPYAAPPVGSMRWREPLPAPGWTGVREADRPGRRCIQDPGGDIEFGKHTDEDCLNLNVWTPPVSGELRPVMVWIHGGAFVNGSGAVYDARWLASRGDIVVVTINYRLGTLGFLAHPALGPPGAVGNYGLADQQAALRWVRDNIANFGGDPDKVTVAGESAGGMSVCDHLVAPESAGLFRAAIIQSAPCGAQADLPTAERISLDYAAGVGCGDPATAADCLRGLPVDKLRKPVWYLRIGTNDLTGPVTGTTVLPASPVTAIAEGGASRVPVLIGTNRDEFTLFVALRYLRHSEHFTAEQYPQLLVEVFGADAERVGSRYPLQDYGDVALAYSAAVTDGLFACVNEQMADDLARDGPVYGYEFNDSDAPTPEPLRALPFEVGASHSLELRYLFDVGGAPALDPAQRALSEQMIDYWSAFVANGDPDAVDQPRWPALTEDGAETGRWMLLQPAGSHLMEDFDRVHQCEFWDSLGR